MMDVSATNSSPQLYGRSNEMELLRQWYDTIVDADNMSSNRTLLGVVSGPIGVGKRALIESTLHPHVKQSHGLFLSGQFYSANHDKSTGKTLSSRPFGAVCEALNRLVRSLNNEDDDDYDNDIKATLREALSVQFRSEGDREILSELVQEVTQWLILDDPNIPKRRYSSASQSISSIPPPFVKTSSVNAPQVQRDVLVHLIQVIASHIPLVLYMEHIESADDASIDLFEALVCNNRSKADYPMGTGLLVIVTVDDESTLPASIMKYAQQQNNSSGGKEDVTSGGNTVSCQTLRLMPLTREHIFTWAVEQFGRNDHNDHVLQDVMDMIYENTDYGIAQYIRFHLSYMSLHIDIDPQWSDATIDIFRTAITNCSPNEIYMKILQNVNPETRTVVELVAALGESGRHSVDASVLDIVLQLPCAGTLVVAQEIGLLESAFEKYYIPVQELQSIVYAMIPESKRASLHLRIGRKLWRNVTSDIHDPMTDANEALLDVVSRNLQLGLGLVTDTLELDIIVMINLKAGKQAAASSSFVAAAEYFESAISALGNRAWTDDCYHVSLVIYNCASEAHYCTANFERMGEALDIVFQKARTFHDKLQAFTTLVYANGTRGHLHEALDTAFDVLRQLGEPVPSHPGILTVMLEYIKTKRMVGQKRLRYFRSLPMATNEDKIAAMQMLNFAMIYSYIVNPYRGMVSAFRLLQLALKYGMTAPAIQAFGAFGYVNCFIMGNRELGVHFGQVALALMEDNPLAKKYFLPRIYLFAYGILNRWVYPVRESLEPLRLANRSAFKTGDMEGYAITTIYWLELSFIAGKPLCPLEYEARCACREVDRFDQVQGLLYLVPLWSILRDLLGCSTLPLSLRSRIVDSASALDQAESDGMKNALAVWYYMQTMVSCLQGQHYEAIEMAKKSRAALPDANLWLTFYEGLSALAVARNVKGKKRWHYLSIGQRAYKYVKKCAKTCPSNFPNKQSLLEAELATIEGRTSKAMALFNDSIKKAQQEGFVHEVGLAYERLGQYQVYLGNSISAVPMLECARDAYNQWGAQSLVDRLEHQLMNLRNS